MPSFGPVVASASAILLVAAMTATSASAAGGAGGDSPGGTGGSAGTTNDATAGGAGGAGTPTGGGGGGGGAGLTGGPGGNGAIDAIASPGGGGGAGGAIAGVGVVGTVGTGNAGGGGGGGGGNGFVGGAFPGAGATGGVGGAGGAAPGLGGGGGGGAGGYGATINLGGPLGSLTVALTGGAGGVGGASTGGTGGSGGDGGIGLFLANTAGTTFTVAAGITGGVGGAAGAGPTPGAAGLGGAGIVGQNLTITMGATGAVTGGVGADAITFTGGLNTLTFVNATTGLTGNIGVTGLLTFDQSSIDVVVANLITGTGSIAKTGTAVIALAGINTYTGSTTVTAGTLRASVTGALGATTGALIVNGGILDIDAATAKGSLSGSGGAINLDAALTVTQTADQTFAGTFTGAAGFTKDGANALTLTGNSATYAGNTTVSAGSLYVDGVLGTAATTLTVDGGSLRGSGTIGGNVVVTNGAMAAGTGPGTLTVAGNLQLTAGSTTSFELNTPGQVDGTGATGNDLIVVGGNLTMAGTLNLATTGATAPVTGAYRLYNVTGTVGGSFATVDAVGATAVVYTVVNAGGPDQVNVGISNGGQVLQFWDGADMLGQPGNSGVGTLDGGDGTWNTANTNWTTAPNFAINGPWAGQVGVFAGAAGTVTVATDQTFEGLQFSTTGYVVNGPGALNMAGGVARFLNVDDGVSATINAEISGAGAGLEKLGLGTMVLGGANSYAGATTVTAGILDLQNASALGAAGGTNTAQAGTTLQLSGSSFTVAGETLTLNGGTLINAGFNHSWLGAITLDAASRIDAGDDGVVPGPDTLTLAGGIATGASALTLGGAGVGVVATVGISGGGSLTKDGEGTWTLSAANSYSGTTSVANGTLSVTGSIASTAAASISGDGILSLTGAGTIAATAITVGGTGQLTTDGGALANNATVTLNSGTFGITGAEAIDALIANGGAVNVNQQTLTAATSVDVNGGTLSSTGGAGSIATAAYTQSAGTVDTNLTLSATSFDFDNIDPIIVTVNGVLADNVSSATLSQTGTGTTILAGANTYSGTTTVSAGVLQVTNASGLGATSGALAVNGGVLDLDASVSKGTLSGTGAGAVIDIAALSTLTITQASDATFAGTLAGDGNLTKLGAGRLTLSGTNVGAATDFNGTIDVAAGTLRVTGGLGSPEDVGAAEITVTNAGSRLEGDGTIYGNVTVNTGATIAAGVGAGTMTIDGNASFFGTTEFEVASAGVVNTVNDLYAVNGNLDLTGGTLEVVTAGTLTQPPGAGYYRVINYSGTLTGAFAAVDVGVDPNYSGTAYYGTANQVNLLVSASGQQQQFWDGADMLGDPGLNGGDGTWSASTTNTNWTEPDTGAINDSWRGQMGIFGPAPASTAVPVPLVPPYNVAVSGVVDAQRLQFISDGYVLNGGVADFVNLVGDAPNGNALQSTIIVDPTLTATIDARISGSGIGLDKEGSGTLILGGDNTFTGPLSISAGVLQIENGAAIGDGVAVSVAAGADLQVASSETIGSLAGAGDVALGAGVGLAVGGDNTSTLFSGVISGTGAAGLAKLGAGTFTLSGVNTFAGTTTIADGTLALSGTGAIANSGLSLTTAAANFDISGAAAAASIVTLAGVSGSHVALGAKRLTITNGSSTFGGIIADGGIVAGVGGGITVAGGTQTLSGANTFTGDAEITGGTLVLQGGGALADTVDVSVSSGATLQVDSDETIGTLVGDAGSLAILSGRLTLGETTDSTFSGDISGAAGLTKQGAGTFTLTGTNSFGGPADATFIDEGTLALLGGNAMGDTTTVVIAAGATLQSFNSETIGALTNGGTVNMQDGDTADVMTINGPYASTGAINLDIDLGGAGVPGPQLSDRIAVVGNFTGTTTFNFNNVSGVDRLQPDILVADLNDAEANPGVATATGLASAGLIQHSLVQDTAGDWVVRSSANLPAVGGIAGNMAVVQATVGGIVNRPSSPFVSGLAASVEPNHCGAGPWMRTTGGAVTASGTTTSPVSESATAEVALRYAGAQFGLDLACFSIMNSHVDVALGAIAGVNVGTSSEPVPGAGVTEATFSQQFGGLYATLGSGPFSADLQARVDQTTFIFDNPQIGLSHAALSSQRYTLSGSASYAIALNDVTLVPAAGIAVSRTTASTLLFDTGNTLSPDPSLSIVGFLGATLAKTIVAPDQGTAITPFLTATAYNDFASAPTATFADPVTGVGQTVASQNLGLFGEASVGLNFATLIEGNGLHQLNATVRADAKFSDRLLGGNLTAQVRAQF